MTELNHSNTPAAAALEGITTVLIDLDDTIWWFTENSKVAFGRTCDAFNVDDFCKREEFHRVYLAKNLELWRLYHHGRIGRDHLMNERFRYTLQQCGYGGDCTATARKMDDYYLTTLGTLKLLVPGALQLLEHLRRRGYATCVVSNGFRGTQQQKLRSAGVDGYIDRMVLSDDCGITKPFRGIYDYALQQCGVDASQAVMIGDEPEADIEGAHNAGLPTIYYNWRKIDPAPGAATFTIIHMADAIPLL
ncbi:MAG: YjjG family noncanonical pyrimidine nucleotidase [Bacteroidales bacterium]|nr:YjjG family noncanonical pyrimidine nucleotidase [Bacteroidales bacterium]MDY3912479.1 YjjG family noncanonical pyrimidine nucleotidase [Sodaliphilus sp.]